MKNKLRTLVIIMLLILAFSFTASYAKEEKVTLDFSGADLVYVIKMIAKQCDCDVVIESSVKGTVNMYLKDVPLADALGVILKTAGYDYKKIDNLIIVAPPKNLAKIASNLYSGGGADTYQVIMLENANCAQIIETLRSAVPGVNLKTDDRINAIIVNGSVGAIKRIKSLISKLDVPATGSFSPDVQEKIFDLKYAKAEDIDANIKALLPGLDYQLDKRTNSLVVRGTKQIFDKVIEYLSKIDTPLQQVSLEVKILSLDKTAQSNVGMNFAAQGGSSSSFTTTFSEVFNNQYSAPTGYQAPPANIDLRFGSFFPFVRSPISIRYVLEALIQTGAAEIVANPTLTTLSGKEATLESSRIYNAPSYDSRTGAYTPRPEPVGVTVKITPTITEDGFIVLSLNPALSDLIRVINNYPYTNKRSVEIMVRVKDGEPVVVGGLRRKATTQTVNKVPLLGDMPIFGGMFKGTAVTKIDNEFIIIVIPRIIPKT